MNEISDFSKPNILIVDDDPVQPEYLEGRLFAAKKDYCINEPYKLQ